MRGASGPSRRVRTCAIEGLLRFDQALCDLDEDYGVLRAGPIEQLMIHEENKVIAARRGPVVCAFNFHPQRSYKASRFPCRCVRLPRQVFDLDAQEFEGFERLQVGAQFPQQVGMHGRFPNPCSSTSPSRTAVVMVPSALARLARLASHRRCAPQRTHSHSSTRGGWLTFFRTYPFECAP